MKKCFKCNIEKPIEDFYPHPRMTDGHLGKCKDCTKKDSKEREEKLRLNPEWVESEKERHREKYYRLGYKEKHKPTPEKKKETMRKYFEKYPEKKIAGNRSNHIKKPNGFEKHHWSYREEHVKDVIFLKPEHHTKLHRHLIYNNRLYLYETLNELLLDTKEKHIEYCNLINND